MRLNSIVPPFPRKAASAAIVASTALALFIDAGLNPAHANEFGPKWQHPYNYYGHAALGGTLSYVVTQQTASPWLGVAAATLAGVAKEKTDQHFSARDVASWAVGGVVGAQLSEHLLVTRHGIAWRSDW